MTMDTVNSSEHVLEEATHIGKCWAAVRGNNVVLTIAMKVPNDVDFGAFRDKAIEALELLGEVKAGDLYEKGMDQYFLPRPHKHQNRSKKKKAAEIKPLKLYRAKDEKSTTSGQ